MAALGFVLMAVGGLGVSCALRDRRRSSQHLRVAGDDDDDDCGLEAYGACGSKSPDGTARSHDEFGAKRGGRGFGQLGTPSSKDSEYEL